MRGGLLKVDPSLVAKLEDPARNMTMFLPIDSAFGKIPENVQTSMNNNQTFETKVTVDLIVFVFFIGIAVVFSEVKKTY